MSSESQATLKRPAPDDLREERLKKIKSNKKEFQSTDIFLKDGSPSETKTSLPVVQQENSNNDMDTVPTLFNRIDNLKTDVLIKEKKRNGKKSREYTPILVSDDDPGQNNVQFSLGFMSVKYCKLTGDGNLGQFSTEPSRCKYTASLEMGCPKAMVQAMPNLQKEQEDTLKFIDTWSKKLLEHIYHCEEDEDWVRTIGKRGLDEFLEKANISCLKVKDGMKYINVARSLVTFRNEPNAPRFWRPLKDGGCERIHPKFIPFGSVIRVSGRFRAYNVNANMYGVSFDMDRDVIVAYVPPKEKPVVEKKNTGPVLPFVDFTF